MKALIIAAIFAATAATAATVAPAANATEFVLPNQSGGHIHISIDTECTTRGKPWLFAYTSVPDGRTMTGCWFLNTDSNMVMVIWNDGSIYSYPAATFAEIPSPSQSTPKAVRY